jgi:3-oxoadipate enol-lactonase
MLPLRDVSFRGSDGWPLFAAIVGELSRADRPVLVLLHGGGPDHQMFLPLAHRLAEVCTVVLPDVRGYGRSVCADPERHTWSQYANDVVALLDHLSVPRVILGGAGLGTTITLRTMVAHPGRVDAAVLISVEEIEDDEKKQAEIEFMDAFAARVHADGIEAAWAPILDDLAPLIGTLVRGAIPRSDPSSIAAAAAIGRDRSFRSVEELAVVRAPVLIFGGMDERHPRAIAEALARVMPKGILGSIAMTGAIRTAEDMAEAFAPPIRSFIDSTTGVLQS